MRVRLAGVGLDNPILPASGCFGYGWEFAEAYDINCLGSLSIKGTTLAPRAGNPQIRIAESASGVLNSVGLQNPGVDEVITRELPKLRACFQKPIMANVSGFSAYEYAETVRRLDSEAQIGWFEINISCPNVHGGGMSFGTSEEAAAGITREVRRATNKPIIIKLTPNVTDICAIARACEREGADGLSLINTLMGMRVDIRARAPVLSNVTGGLSGPAIKPVALRMVYQVYEAVSIPIVGMGGVSSAEDAIEMMLAGATCVGVGAANLVNPYACRDIIAQLPRVMQIYGIHSLTDIIGGAHSDGKRRNHSL